MNPAALLRPTAPALLALPFLAGCAAETLHRDWSQYEGPGREHFLREEVEFVHVEDELEPPNRVLAGVNHGLLRFALAPLGRVYRFLTPAALRRGLENFGENLAYPRRLVASALQGKWSESWDETRRFAVNSTVGIAGLFDPATDRLGLPSSDEDLGQALAHAGWHDSTYLFVPLVGPTTVRDGLGKLGDLLLHPLTYVPFARSASLFNDRSDEFDGLLRTVEVQYDAYELARTLYVLGESVESRDYEWRADDAAEVETLSVVFLQPEEPWFPGRRRDHAVAVQSGLPPLPYSVWMQDEPASLVVVVPGLGSHRLSASMLALAEVAYRAGASVACISSTLNHEFVAAGASVSQPGYLPVDAADVAHAVAAVLADLERRHPGHTQGHERILGGVSLGGAHVLRIAGEPALERRLDMDVYLALDPPVRLRYAAERLDAYYNAPLRLPADEREEWMQATLDKVLDLAGGSLQPTRELPFTRMEAEFLIGIAFRQSLQDLLLATQERHDLGVLRTPRAALRMAPAYREVSRYSFLEYVYGFLLPYYAARSDAFALDERSADALFEASDLRSVETGLRAEERVRVIANSNDFLLSADDRAWLSDTLGARYSELQSGGHMGNLHRDDVQAFVRSVVSRAAAASDEQP